MKPGAVRIVVWSCGILAAVAIVLAANVLLLRTGDTGSEPIGTLSPTLVRPPSPTTTTTTGTTGTTTTEDNDTSGNGRDHHEDD